MLDEALILAGGQATRLGELAKDIPKAILPLAGRPFLEHLLWNLRRQGVRRVVIGTGHLADRIEAVFGNGTGYGLEVTYSHEEVPLGTGGAIKLAAKSLGERFLVLNGDTIFDLNIPALANLISAPGEAAIALRMVPDSSRYGTVVVEGDRIVSFTEKSAEYQGPISGGVYAITQDSLSFLPDGNSSIERDLFPVLANLGRLKGRIFDGFFIDIGIPNDLARANIVVPQWRKKNAILLDRDGVLNVNHGYVCEQERFEWTPDAREAIRWINDSGFLAIIVTNQAGIGRGYYSESQFHSFMAWIQSKLMEAGAHFDAYYFCPHHPSEAKPPFNVQCECRKPNPGMLLQAVADWDIDVSRAVMLGDKESDCMAAERANIKSVRYHGGSLLAAVHDAARLLPSPPSLFP